jgi:hypothetical protein
VGSGSDQYNIGVVSAIVFVLAASGRSIGVLIVLSSIYWSKAWGAEWRRQYRIIDLVDGGGRRLYYGLQTRLSPYPVRSRSMPSVGGEDANADAVSHP